MSLRHDQVRNSAGGFSWSVDPWDRLVRFLILGTEGGTYYATARKLTDENITNVRECIDRDGCRAIDVVTDVSTRGRAYKNDAALLVLAVAASNASLETRTYALSHLPEVARIGTHLLHFVNFVKATRGWGRALRRAVGRWYTDQPIERLAYQLVKYRQRDGFSHRDVLRLAHPNPPTKAHEALFAWVTQGVVPSVEHAELKLVRAFEAARSASTVEEVVELIGEHRLTRESVPTSMLNEARIWETLAPGMGMTAMIRNLGKMTRIYRPREGQPARSAARQVVPKLIRPPKNLVSFKDALKRAGIGPGSFVEAEKVEPHAEPVEMPKSRSGISGWTELSEHLVERITDEGRLRAARVHPLQVLAALTTYRKGAGTRGKGQWRPDRKIVNALERAFELSFGAVSPTGRRWVLALDVSSSMTCGDVGGIPGLTPRVAAAAMALVTLSVEETCHVMAFTHGIVPLDIHRGMKLGQVISATSNLPFGGTDCALPMLWALQNRVEADVFVVYTDSETWAGEIHPAEALRRYRREMGIDAKLIVVGMVSNGFTIADPNDPGMLDVVGMDTATPEVMSAFVSDGPSVPTR